MKMATMRDWGKERGLNDLEDFTGFYIGVVEAIGLNNIVSMIPFKKEAIIKALQNDDKYLNTLPLQYWDNASGSARGAMKRLQLSNGNRVNTTSLSEGVCLLKQAARMWAMQE